MPSFLSVWLVTTWLLQGAWASCPGSFHIRGTARQWARRNKADAKVMMPYGADPKDAPLLD